MGHPHRLTIVRVLLCRAAACCTSERADDAVSIRPAATSGHLGELEDAGVIERARESRGLYSRVNRGTLGQLAALLTGSTHSEDGRAA
jgi:DNA-binding transcriptional ArsR family regulator